MAKAVRLSRDLPGVSARSLPNPSLAETDAVWYAASMALADSGWDCPTEDDWAACGDDVDEVDRVQADEDKFTACFRWLGICTATAETHEATADQPTEYRLRVGVPSHLAVLLIGEVRPIVADSEEPGRQLTNSLPLLRSYVDDFFKGGWSESAQVQGNNGVELRFTSQRVTVNPVQLCIELTADAAPPNKQELVPFDT